MTPRDALDRLSPDAFHLSSGRGLEEWLAHETLLGPQGAAQAMVEYRRFLALVLAGPEAAGLIPSPRVAEVWRLHRDDSRAYARFLAETGTADRLHHQLSRRSVASEPGYAACRTAYRAAFGQAPVRWWPAPLLIRLRQLAPLAFCLGLALGFFFAGLKIKGLPADLAAFVQWSALGLWLFLPLKLCLIWPLRGSVNNPG